MDDRDAGKALAIIRRCIASKRFILLDHFVRRMDRRGLFWTDLMSVIDRPRRMWSDGYDEGGRPRWIISGPAADGLPIEIVCVLETDDRGHTTVFITLYWNR